MKRFYGISGSISKRLVSSAIAAMLLALAGSAFAAAPVTYTVQKIPNPDFGALGCNTEFWHQVLGYRINAVGQVAGWSSCFVPGADATRPWVGKASPMLWEDGTPPRVVGDTVGQGNFGRDLNDGGDFLVLEGGVSSFNWSFSFYDWSGNKLGGLTGDRGQSCSILLGVAINNIRDVLYGKLNFCASLLFSGFILRPDGSEIIIPYAPIWVNELNDSKGVVFYDGSRWSSDFGFTYHGLSQFNIARINDFGDVSGYIQSHDPISYFPTKVDSEVWRRDGSLVPVANLPGFDGAALVFYSNQDIGVGWSIKFPQATTVDQVATVWIHDVPYDLNSLIPPGLGVHLFAALDVNDSGVIIAQGYDTAEPLRPQPGRVYEDDCVPPQCNPNNPNRYDPSITARLVHTYVLTPVVSLDAPALTPVVTGTLGGGGYYRSDVSVTWVVDGKGLPVTTSQGCVAATLAVDVRAKSYGCAATSSAGINSTGVVLKRDVTPPVVTVSPSVAANAAGWQHAAVSVAFTGTDATSGVASCSPNTLVSLEGANQSSSSGTCTDVAGNVSSAVSLSGINIDLTPPAVSASRASAANDAGWYKAPLVVSFTATDALSGVAADACDAPVTVSSEGAGQSVSGSCRDLAGNNGSGTVFGISLDLTAPSAAAVVTPAANGAGWHKTIPTVSFEGSDAMSGSGVASCSGPTAPTADGAGQSLSGTCTDRAGNVSTAATATVNLDRAVPTVVISAPLEGVTYGVGAVLPANFVCSDLLSGMATCVGTVAKASAFDTATIGTKTFTVTGTDNAGNSTSQSVNYSVAAGYDNGLTTNRTSIAFPSQQVLTSSSAQAITLTNPGSTPVGLSSITLGGTNGSLFSRSTTCAGTLAAGASCNINVLFRPATMGAKTGSLIVTTTGGAAKVTPLTGTGLAPPLTLSTAALAFGGQLKASLSAAKQVGVTNNWSEPVRLTSLTITGTDSTNFSRSTTCGATLPAGSFCSASVYFRPSTPGDKTAQLNIASQAASSPQVVALTGTGTFLQVTATPTGLDFSFQPVGVASAARTVTVTNTGTQLLKLTAVAITGTDATSYSRSTTCGASLAIGASCDVRVFFRPTVLGRRSATLTISATGTAAKTVALVGVGI